MESRGLAKDIAAIAARGEPTTLAADPAGAGTSERSDAARIYAAAAERVHELPADGAFRLWRIDVDASSGPPPDLSELESIYRPNSPPLQLLDQATPLDFDRFGDVAPELSTNQSPLVTLGVLADVRADLLSARDRGDAAADALVASARLLRTMSLTFYRAEGSGRLLASVRILLRHTTPGEVPLARLQHALMELSDADSLVGDLQQSRAQFLDGIGRPRETLTEAILQRAVRPSIVRSSRRQLAAYEEALAVARQPWPQKLAAGDALERKYSAALRRMGRRGFFARLTRPYGIGVATPVSLAGVDLAARRACIAALAVERYRRAHGGLPPPALDALVPSYLPAVPIDPFSGAPIIYKPGPHVYVLYSVDTNRKDDGGALYGVGSRGQLMPRTGERRDLGIRVEDRN